MIAPYCLCILLTDSMRSPEGITNCFLPVAPLLLILMLSRTQDSCRCFAANSRPIQISPLSKYDEPKGRWT